VSLHDAIDAEASRSGFSGVVRVDGPGGLEMVAAYGLADRAHGVANRADTVFATASGTKGFTALAVMSLVDEGVLDLATPARGLLGDDLPLVADDVTVEHLLGHTSGIGDYLDETGLDSMTDYVLTRPVHTLDTAESYLGLLDGLPAAFPAGERFAYNNSGYVLLAILAERASGTSYHDLVRTRVTAPAGMTDTAFLRSDELPGTAAIGYLAAEGLRSNVLHLPVLGVGDGGMFATAADLSAFWGALFAGRIVSLARVDEMVRPRSDWPEEQHRYGLGFHLHETSDAVWLEGYDAGVSFLSQHWPSTGTSYTVVSNWTDGAWPLVKLLDQRLTG
jgi:CubicO group peptidase (beta-lactamase class C family)